MEAKVKNLEVNVSAKHFVKDKLTELKKRREEGESAFGFSFLYHQKDDEKNALKEAIESVRQQTKEKTRFEEINVNNATDLIRRGKLESYYIKSFESEKRKRNKEVNLRPNIVGFISSVASLIIFPLVSIISNLLLHPDNNNLFYLFLTLVSLMAIGCVIVSVFFLVGKIRERKIILANFSKELAFTDDLIDGLTKKDFINVSDVVFYLNYEGDELFLKFIDKFIESIPIDKKTGFLFLKTEQISDNAKYNPDLEKLYKKDKERIRSLRIKAGDRNISRCYGCYLIPLTSSEKIALKEELHIEYLPEYFYERGRDFIYNYVGSDERIVGKYRESVDLAKKYLDDEKEKYLSTDSDKTIVILFVAIIKKLFSCLDLKWSSHYFDIFFSKEVLSTVKDELGLFERSEEKIENAVRIISRIDDELLIALADYAERFLSDKLSYIDQKKSEVFDDADVDLPSLFRLALQSVIGYFKTIPNSADGKYFKAALKINGIFDKIISTEKLLTPELLGKRFTDHYLFVAENIIKYNMRTYSFIENAYILERLSDLYDQTRESDYQKEFDVFYRSDIVKNAFRLNAIVNPRLSISDEDGASDICVKLFESYLNNLVKDDDELIETNPPYWFGPFSASLDRRRYYSLLKRFDERPVLDFYKALSDFAISQIPGFEIFERFTINLLQEEKSGGNVNETVRLDFGNDKNLLDTLIERVKAIEGLELIEEGNRLGFDVKKPSVLMCGYLCCELFYLIYDLWALNNLPKVDYNFKNSIKSVFYRATHTLSYYKDNLNRTNIDYTEFVESVLNNGFYLLLFLYFASEINKTGLSENDINSMKIYLKDHADRVSFDISVSDFPESVKDSFLTTILYGLKIYLDINTIEKFLPIDQIVNVEDEEIKEFVEYLIFDRPFEIGNDGEPAEICERIKKYGCDVCFLLYKFYCEKDARFYDFFDEGLFEKIIDSNYINKYSLLFAVFDKSVERKTPVLKEKYIERIASKLYATGIDSCQNSSIAAGYLRIEKYEGIIKESKGEEFYDVLINKTRRKFFELTERKLEYSRTILQNKELYIFAYAKVFIELRVKPLICGFNEKESGQSFDKSSPMIIEDENGNKFLCKEYYDYICKICNNGSGDIHYAIKVVDDVLSVWRLFDSNKSERDRTIEVLEITRKKLLERL